MKKLEVNDTVKCRYAGYKMEGKIIKFEQGRNNLMALVHIPGFSGHSDGGAQDNDNNWWFNINDLELVIKGSYITYKEFQKQVTYLGYVIEDTEHLTYVKYDNNMLSSISKQVQYQVDNDWRGWTNNSGNHREVYDLITRLGGTPINYRGEVVEKKYYLISPIGGYSDKYLNLNTLSGNLKFSSNNETSTYKTQFTRDEIIDLKDNNSEEVACFIDNLIEEEV